MTIHIVNPLWNANGGSERRAVELAGLLAGQTRTRLWVDSGADTSWLPPGIPLSRLRPALLRFPRGGTLIFVGCYFEPSFWLRLAKPERIVVLVNTPNPEDLIQFMTRLGTLKISTPVELRYAAGWLSGWLGIPGPVDASPVDLERFRPRPTAAAAQRPFVIGRLSRNVTYKHHKNDIEVYRHLASEGCHVRIMGPPHWLVQALKGSPGIELLAPGRESAEDFLASLDCFYYRTDPSWVEPSGRVVFEAMASGLPVVCGPGGYREWMRDGHDSLFVDSTEAALAGLQALAADRVRATTLGSEARRSMERTFSRQALGELTHSLREGSTGQPAHVILEVLSANGFT